jgi:hypothetical protein
MNTAKETYKWLEGFAGKPLCVDLDGTLHRGDCSLISFKLAFRLQPASTLAALRSWPFSGRAQLKNTLAQICKNHFPWNDLQWNSALLEKLKQLKSAHPLILISGTSEILLSSQVPNLSIFEQIHGTRNFNLIGETKARALATLFPQGFIYIGNSRADIQVWKTCALGFSVLKDQHGGLPHVRLVDSSWNSFQQGR